MKKILLRIANTTALILSMGVLCFGQLYKQTNLVSNTRGLLLSPILSWPTPGALPWFGLPVVGLG